MKTLALTLLLLAYLVMGTKALNRISESFLEKSDKCFEQLHVPPRYRDLFRNFQYPDTQIVHTYLHCVHTDLDIWDDRRGFNAEKIYNEYRDKADGDVLLSIINNCNQSTQDNNPKFWCYRAFVCMLNTNVGDWFKAEVQRTRQPNIPNGHV